MKLEDKMDLITECQSHVGRGWHDILRRLIGDLFELGWDGQVLQVKEKFGGLRFYIGAGNGPIGACIQDAENESLRTCEECGAPGKQRDGGWIKTLCDEHSKKEVANG